MVRVRGGRSLAANGARTQKRKGEMIGDQDEHGGEENMANCRFFRR
jgi:hypothetical protein